MKKELNKTKSVFVKKSKVSLAKSSTALTCLVGLSMFSSDIGSAVTATGSFTASGSVDSVCTVSGSTMTFAAYTGSEITANSVITSECTTGTTYGISFSTSPNTGSEYYLVRVGGNVANATDYLSVIFKNGSTTMTNAVTGITGTGTGSPATAGTITGTMAASQSGKTAGTFNKTMALTITY
jgi:spore coat protein U-like protein